MPRELRISVTIALPDDAFAQSALMALLQPAAKVFEAAIAKAVKADVPVVASVVNARPTKAKPDPVVVAQETDAAPAIAATEPAAPEVMETSNIPGPVHHIHKVA